VQNQTHPNASVPHRALWALWGLFWLLMIVVAFEDNRSDEGIRWWMPVLWEGSSCLVATGVLLLQRRKVAALRPLLSQPLRWFGKQYAWLPLVALGFILGIYAVRHGVYALVGLSYTHPSWPYLLFYESVKVLLFATLWMGIIFGLESFASWRNERERLLEVQKHLAESQLAQLKSQLQPHFLFNALNTISSIMQVDVERADRLLTQLADLLRATLQAGRRDMTSLRDELALLRVYARIMEERFAGRASLEWRVAEDALEAEVPALLLQPLLENAYKHGVERSTEPVAIFLGAQRAGDQLEVVVRNGGSLTSAPETGIGLRNCRDRLAVLYGTAASLTLTEADGTVVARLSLPWKPHSP
jgi:two-component sensor histidine kinase